MAEIHWYYAKGQEQFGPVGPAELKQLADTGDLLPQDPVWREGMPGWAPAARVAGLFQNRDSDSHVAVRQTTPMEAGPAVGENARKMRSRSAPLPSNTKP